MWKGGRGDPPRGGRGGWKGGTATYCTEHVFIFTCRDKSGVADRRLWDKNDFSESVWKANGSKSDTHTKPTLKTASFSHLVGPDLNRGRRWAQASIRMGL